MTTPKKTTVSHATHPPKAESAEAPAPVTTTPAPAETTVPAQASPAATAPPASDTLSAGIQQMLAYLATLPALLGTKSAVASPLTIEARRSLVRMRTGGEAQLPTIFDLADQYGLTLPGSSTADARADLQRATILQPLAAHLGTALTLVEDELGQAQSRSWRMGRTAYTTLARLIPTFPALQEQLDPMASFMAIKHKSAPTILRQAEAKTLSKSRATRKTKKEATGTEATAATPTAATPVAPSAAPAAGATTAPAAPASPASVATAPTATSGTTNGAPHS